MITIQGIGRIPQPRPQRLGRAVDRPRTDLLLLGAFGLISASLWAAFASEVKHY